MQVDVPLQHWYLSKGIFHHLLVVLPKEHQMPLANTCKENNENCRKKKLLWPCFLSNCVTDISNAKYLTESLLWENKLIMRLRLQWGKPRIEQYMQYFWWLGHKVFPIYKILLNKTPILCKDKWNQMAKMHCCGGRSSASIQIEWLLLFMLI